TIDGYNLLGLAKLFIRSFLHQVNNGKNNHSVKYILATSDRLRYCIKTEYHDPIYIFLEQLELLLPTEASRIGTGFASVFEFLSLRRMIRHMDSFYRSEDGPTPSSIFYQEKHRWDQKLFTFYLSSQTYTVPTALQELNSRMRGQLYSLQTSDDVLKVIGNILGTDKDFYEHAKEIYPYNIFSTCGVNLNFVEATSNYDPKVNNCLEQIYVDPLKFEGFYPIPEDFWIEPEAVRYPMEIPSLSIPTIAYWKNKDFYKTHELPLNFPRDTYVVSECEMTRELKCQKPGTKWPVYIRNSSRISEYGEPFGYLVANKKNEYDLEPLAKVFVTCKLEKIVPSGFFSKPKTEGIDAVIYQAVQQAHLKYDQMKNDITKNRYSITRPTPYPEKSIEGNVQAERALANIRKITTLAQLPSEPVVMGNYEEVMAKRDKHKLRDPYEENVGKKTKRDQRAFGSPFKNRELKPLPKRTFPKLPSKIRDKLSATPKSIYFPGFPEKSVKPFVIVVGRQITTTIEASTKTRSLKLPTNSHAGSTRLPPNQAIKSQPVRMDNNFQTLSSPLSPASETSESPSSPLSLESTPMNVDESHTPASIIVEEVNQSNEDSEITDSSPQTGLDVLASLSTVLTTSQPQSEQKQNNSDNAEGVISMDKVESVESCSSQKIATIEDEGNAENTGVSASEKSAEPNNLDFLSRAAELVLSQEHTGLDMLSQAVSQVTDMDDVAPTNVNEVSSASKVYNADKMPDIGRVSDGGQALIEGRVSDANQTSGESQGSETGVSRWRSIKSTRYSSLDSDLRTLESSKFAAELRRQISADTSCKEFFVFITLVLLKILLIMYVLRGIAYDEANILGQIRDFAVSENYADEIKSKFLYLISKFSRAYKKIELSQSIETILRDIRFDLKSYFNDRRMRSMK
ncbi:13437_t:CDS:10, partial [Acaulospora colombiana]